MHGNDSNDGTSKTFAPKEKLSELGGPQQGHGRAAWIDAQA
jgi:hypothetical protein